MAAASKPPAGLTVAVTGPTGEIGRAFIAALERSRGVARIVAMARRPFEPAAHGWRKTEYRRGDVLDRGASTRWSPGPTWSSTWRSSSCRPPRTRAR